jgi:hypothetical protein
MSGLGHLQRVMVLVDGFSWNGGLKQTPQTPQTPQTSLRRRDGAHAIDAQLAVLILPRTQDKRALTTADRLVEVS